MDYFIVALISILLTTDDIKQTFLGFGEDVMNETQSLIHVNPVLYHW